MNIQGAIAFTITERTPERVVAEMPIPAGIRNPFGVVQASAILWSVVRTVVTGAADKLIADVTTSHVLTT